MISLEPSRFRSPLLEALPPAPPGRDRRALRRRRLAVVLVVAAAVLAAVAVGTRRLSLRGPGLILYRLHDEVFLPLKGYLFTRLFPVSWIYVLAGLTLLLFGLTALAWARPLTPAWQTAVGRRALSWRSMRPVLSLWGRSFGGLRRLLRAGSLAAEKWPAVGRRLTAWAGALDGPTLLEELVEHEREAALELLDGLDPATPESVGALAPALDATLFSLELAASSPSGGDRPLIAAVERLDEVLLRLDLVRLARGAPARGATEAAAEELRMRIETEISARLRQLLPVAPRQPDFSVSSLALELALVLGIETPRSWPPELLESRRERVLEGVEARRRALDGSRQRLERSASYSLRRGRRTVPELPAGVDRAAAGLAVDVAVFAALRFGETRGALAFLEGLEGLRFAVLASGDGVPDGGDPDSETEALLAALAGLPRPLDYRVCARLLGLETTRAADLAEAVARKSEVVSEADLRLLSARRTDLSTAAADV